MDSTRRVTAGSVLPSSCRALQGSAALDLLEPTDWLSGGASTWQLAVLWGDFWHSPPCSRQALPVHGQPSSLAEAHRLVSQGACNPKQPRSCAQCVCLGVSFCCRSRWQAWLGRPFTAGGAHSWTGATRALVTSWRDDCNTLEMGSSLKITWKLHLGLSWALPQFGHVTRYLPVSFWAQPKVPFLPGSLHQAAESQVIGPSSGRLPFL